MTKGNAYLSVKPIIPYQELLGNYDSPTHGPATAYIIPYQELLGNYDAQSCLSNAVRYYTIPRAIREL